jgi:predicted Fe-Mo cluster-binding NifX family protein
MIKVEEVVVGMINDEIIKILSNNGIEVTNNKIKLTDLEKAVKILKELEQISMNFVPWSEPLPEKLSHF